MALHIARKPWPELQSLSNFIEQKPECFASGSQDIRAAALGATKFLFDLSVQSENISSPHITELLISLEPASAPRTRSQSNATGERTRTLSPPPRAAFETTPLTSLFVDGMSDDQVWAQLDIRAKHICDTLERVLEGGVDGDIEDEEEEDEEEDSSSQDEIVDERFEKALEAMANGEDVDLDALRNMGWDGSLSDEDAILDESSEEGIEDGVSDGEEMDHAEDFAEGFTDLRDPSSDESADELSAPSNMLLKRKSKKKNKSQRHPELDDGFFDLATFNAETEQAEARSSSKGRLGGQEESEDDDDDMSVDLFAPIDEEEEMDQVEGDQGEAMYRDFFEPPKVAGGRLKTKPKNGSSKATGQVRFHEEVRVKKIRAKGKNLPLSSMDDDDDAEEEEGSRFPTAVHQQEWISSASSEDSIVSGDDEDAESHQDEDDPRRDTIERLKDDLFAEEEESPHQDFSTHERRVSELREQIATLESENVGPKDWVLMGEAGSRTRPQNSLLEEDLEFERAMKAVPVITEETVQVLEERIKARILEGRFDDVIRLRPVDDKPFLPSRFFELKDTKSAQSLAQVYEDEFVASRTGDVVGEDRDGKLKKEHDEIERMWEGISHKLDALCNAHFMPKQPKATISTVTNVSATTLESALPTTKSVNTMLAPEEVFTPLANGSRARSELTPSEKRALRSKERKAKKKSREALETHVDKYAKVRSIGGVKKQKRAALESVVKSGKGVTVVGKPRKEKSKKEHRTSTS
ncbi:U3 small nucleolar ribonucleoprotein complex, subunit Mpp10 [Lyophyllum atratum]|nr:U3 small nucleolar ribonucleoprotein complex, subunit Mpp10 [Lyophyllum atratum]